MQPRRKLPILAALLILAALVPGPPPAAAHDLGFTRTAVLLLPDDAFRIDMIVDLDALALGAPSSTDSAELVRVLRGMSDAELEETVGRLREMFVRRVRVRFGEETFLPEVSFPDRGSERAGRTGTLLGLTARFEGRVPAGAGPLTLQASRAFPPLHLSFYDLRARSGAPPSLDEILPVDASGKAAGSGLGVAGTDLVTMRQVLEKGARSDPYPLEAPPPQPSFWQVAAAYLRLGYEHILPLGTDHILFVLGLFLLNTAWRPLLVQVTAFTAAHTLTLGLSTYGVISLSPRIVEPLIAASIAWIAFENVATGELKPWRPAVVFGFGLLHGLGFAGVLAQLGLPRDQYLTALVTFNAGVELGQLSVILVALAALGWARNRPWYRARITVPASLAIGMIGLYWAVQRVFWP